MLFWIRVPWPVISWIENKCAITLSGDSAMFANPVMNQHVISHCTLALIWSDRSMFHKGSKALPVFAMVTRLRELVFSVIATKLSHGFFAVPEVENRNS